MLRSAVSFPVGAARSKFGGTELLREPNSLRSSAFCASLVRFLADFVFKKRLAMGAFGFNPYRVLIFARKTDCGLDDLHVAGNPRSCVRQKLDSVLTGKVF